MPTPAHAQEDFASSLTEEKVQLIRQNCISAQVALQRFQRSDLVARTNRGRSYESLLELMAALNSRLALHKRNEPRMIEIANELQNNFSAFSKTYTEYEEDMKNAIRTKCVDQPVTFYQHVVDARVERGKLKSRIDIMQQLITEYQQEYLSLKQKLEQGE